jgi:hypothetical protein
MTMTRALLLSTLTDSEESWKREVEITNIAEKVFSKQPIGSLNGMLMAPSWYTPVKQTSVIRALL